MNIFKHRPLALCCFVFILTFFFCNYIPVIIKILLFAAAAVTALLFFKKKGTVAAISLAAAVACILGYFFYDVHSVRATEVNDGFAEFEITEIGYKDETVAYVDGINKSGYRYHYTLEYPPEIAVGDVISGNVTYKFIDEDGEFDTERYYNSKDIWLEGIVEDAKVTGHKKNLFRDMLNSVREFCTERFNKYLKEDTAAILSALSIGDKDNLDDSLVRDFNRAGLSHMLAISGMHLSIIMSCMMMLTDLLSLNRRHTYAALTVICLCYIFIAGASGSIVRAGIMFILMSLASVFNRYSDSLTNLLVSVTLILLFNPCAVFDIGLILSFTATFGIIIIVGFYVRKLVRKNKGVASKIKDWLVISVLTSVSAQAFSFIPVLFFFNSVSTVSVISNLITAPVLTLILFTLPLFIVGSLIPYVGIGIGAVLDIICKLLSFIVSLLSGIKGCQVSLDMPFVRYSYFAVAIGIVLIIIIKKRYSYIMPYLCWFLLFTVLTVGYNFQYINQCDVMMFSRSSSDAIFLKTFGTSIYFDLGSGSNSSENRSFTAMIDHMYMTELDNWVITCYSDDISYCAKKYMNEFYIRNIYLPYPYDGVSDVVAKELEYQAKAESVDIIYYEYGEEIDIYGISACIYEPVVFENKDTKIPSLELSYKDREVFYAGRGYFDYSPGRLSYDILFAGDFGTKSKIKNHPQMLVTEAVIGRNSDLSARDILGEIVRLTSNGYYTKIRLKNIY